MPVSPKAFQLEFRREVVMVPQGGSEHAPCRKGRTIRDCQSVAAQRLSSVRDNAEKTDYDKGKKPNCS
jgi:hypothetical protein